MTLRRVLNQGSIRQHYRHAGFIWKRFCCADIRGNCTGILYCFYLVCIGTPYLSPIITGYVTVFCCLLSQTLDFYED